MNLKPIAANQTEVIRADGSRIFFSYRTPVAAYIADGCYDIFPTGSGFIRTEKKWSVTTSRHINKWLDGMKAETRPQSFFDSLV